MNQKYKKTKPENFVKHIVLDVAGTSIKVSLSQARQLKNMFDDLFNGTGVHIVTRYLDT